MTLISVHSSEGCVGRCDARCYAAVSEECDCVCGGANHGKGIRVAIENTAAHARRWAAEYRARTGADVEWYQLGGEQIGLFE